MDPHPPPPTLKSKGLGKKIKFDFISLASASTYAPNPKVWLQVVEVIPRPV